MDRKEKLAMLQGLSENELTQKFLITLYESMGCKNVRYTHGKSEFGRDIIYYKDDEYGNRIYTGVQVKKTRIMTRDVANIFSQIHEAFAEPFTDLSDGKKKDLDRLVVLTSNEFLEEAKDALFNSLRGARLDKNVTFIDGNQLLAFLERYF
ncbi:MAG: restriction endonuclease, partial [Proteobacteria bacterium]|nr:restriction endonuclease [Pseudomonadota bacterium]